MQTSEIIYESVKAGYCEALGSNPENLLENELEAIKLITKEVIDRNFFK